VATLTYVFDPDDARGATATAAVLALWRTHAGQLRFEAVPTGAWTTRFGLGPDSERSARAFSALRAAAPGLELPLAHELHQALGVRGERLGRGVLTAIARRLGLDPALALDQLRRPGHRERARADLRRGRALQLGAEPTLLFEHEHVVSRVPLDAGPLAALIEPMSAERQSGR
jgi:hypothetical protein